MKSLPAIALAATLLCPAAACADNHAQHAPAAAQSSAPADARVYIISPLDGSTVGQTFTVRFGLAGMGVAPAGELRKGTGHHHLLIDADTLPAADQPIPSDAQHLHFGAGQTETVLQLPPGTHTLQLDLADGHHMQFNPPLVSPKITVHVK